ncbi:hypothetical protein MTBBW1_810005 [Desulfamplus magnetovallimortis]|uniref:Magnesium and cobalt transport protein CorA n=1 Tax=Desulfamplus magnetovallimortis TaxID=1246637 RepID=A0A1W1HK58_9BACT|nr:CorA family divalent cation transporter [Desulfamplus magnetovallimortis]SLM32907.1 hypothetical protein MTBBW1_810005 [Desulfamplus magnetovallimortis]
MADDRHNRRDESRFKNRMLPRLSYKKPRNQSTMIRVFDLHEGCLRQIPIGSKKDLAGAKPIWIDLVKPESEQLAWAREIFGVDIPDPMELTDLETSARFYVEDNGELHLHSDFLLDRENESRNVAVAFILNLRDIESLDSHTAFLFNKMKFLLDATDSSISINQNKDIKRLTVLSVVCMPLNMLLSPFSSHSNLKHDFIIIHQRDYFLLVVTIF